MKILARRKERAKRFFLKFFGWDMSVGAARVIWLAWLRLANRDREIVQGDTFEAACNRHSVTPEKLAWIMKDLRARKRSFWVLTLVALYFWGLGMVMIHQHGLTLGRLNMVVASLGLMAVFMALNLKYAFRYWQCESRHLGSLDEFWGAGGVKLILKW